VYAFKGGGFGEAVGVIKSPANARLLIKTLIRRCLVLPNLPVEYQEEQDD
jgi:hypothetical protein